MRLLLATAAMLLCGTAVHAQTIYPIDRAEILTGAKFDFKVEFPGLLTADQVKMTVNDTDAVTALGRAASFIEREDGKDQSAIVLRDVTLAKPGRFDHHRLGEFSERLCHRPQVGRECDGRLCRPQRKPV
jgi:alkaline phosphatase